MGLLDKVKNFFYDEEDVEDEYEEETHKEVKKENKRKYEPVKEDIVRKRENRLEKENEEVTERELFKADSTFNFPMDLDDTLYEKKVEINKKSEVKEKPKEEIKVDYSPQQYLEFLELIRTLESQGTDRAKANIKIIQNRFDTASENYKTAKFIFDNIEDITNQIKTLGNKGIVKVNC